MIPVAFAYSHYDANRDEETIFAVKAEVQFHAGEAPGSCLEGEYADVSILSARVTDGPWLPITTVQRGIEAQAAQLAGK